LDKDISALSLFKDNQEMTSNEDIRLAANWIDISVRDRPKAAATPPAD